jgi:hypothetical protein
MNCIGYTGTTDFFRKRGGFVYEYEPDGPRLIKWFVPVDIAGKVVCFSIPVSESPSNEWWYGKLDEVVGYHTGDLREMANGTIRDRCSLYPILINSWGASWFDPSPTVMMLSEAVASYRDELLLNMPQDMKPAFK